MVSSLNDENTLAIIKADIQYLNNSATANAIEELSREDRLDLLELMNEDEHENTITYDEFVTATARWRTK